MKLINSRDGRASKVQLTWIKLHQKCHSYIRWILLNILLMYYLIDQKNFPIWSKLFYLSIYLSICLSIYLYLSTYIYIYIYIYIYSIKFPYKQYVWYVVCLYKVHVNVYIQDIHIYTYAYAYIFIYINIYVYSWIYMYMYIYI